MASSSSADVSRFNHTLSTLTNQELISAMNSDHEENTESLLFFGNEKGRARRTLKRVYQRHVNEVNLLVVLLRMCRRTSARIELQKRAALLNLPLSKYIANHCNGIVHAPFLVPENHNEISYEELLEPIHPPSHSPIHTNESNKVPSPPPSFLDKIPTPSPDARTTRTYSSYGMEGSPDCNPNDNFSTFMSTFKNYSRDYNELVQCLDKMTSRGQCTDRSRRVALQKFNEDPEWKALLVQEGGRPIEKLITNLNCHLNNKRAGRGGKRSKRGTKREGTWPSMKKSQKHKARRNRNQK